LDTVTSQISQDFCQAETFRLDEIYGVAIETLRIDTEPRPNLVFFFAIVGWVKVCLQVSPKRRWEAVGAQTGTRGRVR
jgi:hypothetical protein